MKNKFALLFGLIFLLFFLLTYYNFERFIWVNDFVSEFKQLIIPSVIFFFSGFFIYWIFKSWINKNVKKLYLLTYFSIIISVLFSYHGIYKMGSCSIIQKCNFRDGTVICPPRSLECSIYINILTYIFLLSFILILFSLVFKIYTKFKK